MYNRLPVQFIRTSKSLNHFEFEHQFITNSILKVRCSTVWATPMHHNHQKSFGQMMGLRRTVYVKILNYIGHNTISTTSRTS